MRTMTLENLLAGFVGQLVLDNFEQLHLSPEVYAALMAATREESIVLTDDSGPVRLSFDPDTNTSPRLYRAFQRLADMKLLARGAGPEFVVLRPSKTVAKGLVSDDPNLFADFTNVVKKHLRL